MRTCVCNERRGRLCLWHYGQLSPRERKAARIKAGLRR